MIIPPSNIQKIYQSILDKSSVLKTLHIYYNKWFRYYWDFCHKYDKPVDDQNSLTLFTNKLFKYNQNEFQVKQAVDAISLYYKHINNYSESPELNKNQNNQLNTLVHYDTTQESSSDHTINENNSVYSNKSNVQAQSVAIKESDIKEPDVSSKKLIKSKKIQKALQSESKKTGTNWTAAFDGLYNETKIRHYSPKTFKTYKLWLSKFQTFTKSKPLKDLVDQDIKNFLTHLAVEKNVAASTQNQAFNALLFFFRHVLKKEPGNLKDTLRAKRKPHIPVVLSRNEIDSILEQLVYPYQLIVKLLYGCGLRLFECLNLRVHWFNIDACILTIHDGKGNKDRTVPLPKTVIPEILDQFENIENLHAKDLSRDYDGVFLPAPLENKKKFKNYSKALIWQWFFPAIKLTTVPETNELKRYHLHERHVQRAIKEAVIKAKICKSVTSRTFRHSFASHLLAANYDIKTIQELMGHSDVKTTMIYTHTIQSQTIKERVSPLDLGTK
jgi:integron integrase